MATVQFYHTRQTGDDLEPAFTTIQKVVDQATTESAIVEDLNAQGITAIGGTNGRYLGMEYRADQSPYDSNHCGVSIAIECDETKRATCEAIVNTIYLARA